MIESGCGDLKQKFLGPRHCGSIVPAAYVCERFFAHFSLRDIAPHSQKSVLVPMVIGTALLIFGSPHSSGVNFGA